MKGSEAVKPESAELNHSLYVVDCSLEHEWIQSETVFIFESEGFDLNNS